MAALSKREESSDSETTRNRDVAFSPASRSQSTKPKRCNRPVSTSSFGFRPTCSLAQGHPGPCR